MKNADMPAMPIEFSGFGLYKPEAFVGLTKREMFAMAAMQGILSSLADDCAVSPNELARCSVRNANALLAELERRKPKC